MVAHPRVRKLLIYLAVFFPLFFPLAHKQETEPTFLNFKASIAAHQSGRKRGPVEQLLLQLTIRVTEEPCSPFLLTLSLKRAKK